MKGLAAFDFDHTIIDENSDTTVVNLVKEELPAQLKELHQTDGWTQFMQGVFDILFTNGVTMEVYNSTIKSLHPTTGMIELIHYLHDEMNFDIVIISDSNSYFIEKWLKYYNLEDKIRNVFTNPAHFIDGVLKIQMYHYQDYCKLSTKNLCKGQILLDFIQSQLEKNISYDKILYCGDGNNDLCPILKLSSKDLAFIRENYKCHGLIKKIQQGILLDNEEKQRHLNAKVIVWKNGCDILNYLKRKSF